MPIIILKIVAIALVAIGTFIVFIAKNIVIKYDLNSKVELPEEQLAALSEEDIAGQRLNSAILSVKLKGMLLASPGFILILILFR